MYQRNEPEIQFALIEMMNKEILSTF